MALQLGVVVIHGFTSTPYSIAYLANALQEAGCEVRTPLLPGHGTAPADLDHVTWQQWAGAVAAAFDELRTRHDRVAVVGQSLGGLLALHLAATRSDVAAAVSLAAPLWLEGTSKLAATLAATPWLRRRLRAIPKIGGADVRDALVKQGDPGYQSVSLAGLAQLTAFMGVVDGELESIRAPVCVIHSKQDHTAPLACALKIASAARAKRVRLLLHSYHLIAVDIEKDDVAAECLSFLREYVKP